MGSRGQAKEIEIKDRGDSSESAALEGNQVNFSLMDWGPLQNFSAVLAAALFAVADVDLINVQLISFSLKPQMEGKSVFGELLANSDGVREDLEIVGWRKQRLVPLTLISLLRSRVGVRGCFLEIGALDTVASTVLRDFYSSSLTSRLSHLHGCVGHYKIYFPLSFPEPTEVHFLRRYFPGECSVIAKRSHRSGLKGWCQQKRSAFFSAHLLLASHRHFDKTATTGI